MACVANNVSSARTASLDSCLAPPSLLRLSRTSAPGHWTVPTQTTNYMSRDGQIAKFMITLQFTGDFAGLADGDDISAIAGDVHDGSASAYLGEDNVSVTMMLTTKPL